MVRLHAATLEGLLARQVDVECAFHRGLPAFSIVGLADSAIQESRERVKAALSSFGFSFPPLKVTVGLFPSDMPKAGSHFDLAIALSIALHDAPSHKLDDFLVLGELGLDGTIRASQTIFPIILSLAKAGIQINVLTSTEIVNFLNKIPGVKIFAARTLSQAVLFAKNESVIKPIESQNLDCNNIQINDILYYYDNEYELNFSEVKGQKIAKRAALIAAAGFHNIALEGSPGCGKSMIIKRLKHILPPMSLDEVLDASTKEFLDGGVPTFRAVRPFRSPHHTATRAAIFGGGSREGKIGEVALANNGTLFFDELPLFDKIVLEALREPLEDNRLLVSRVNSKIEYDASFLFAAALNPCPCGNLLSSSKPCRCTQSEITKYKNRLSEPFLDRIDIFVQMDEPKDIDIYDITSKELFNKVLAAFCFRLKRLQNVHNGKLGDAAIAFLSFSDEAQALLTQARERFGLSLRALAKVKKVSRTIADLDESDNIQKNHVLEALSYRKR